MPTILKTKNSVTTTVVPTTLQQGELAVNITDKKMWVGNAATTPVQILGAGTTGTAAGSNTQVQYNSSGTLAGDADFTFNGTTVTMTNDASISGLTVGKGGGAVSSNTAVGFQANNSNTTGTFNVAVGYNSGSGTTTGSFNNSLGGNNFTSALTADGNNAFGLSALRFVTSGANNTAMGNSALFTNTTGGSNLAIGGSALQSNTTASSNTAVGYQAGYSNTTGNSNTFIGLGSGQFNTTGTANTFIGLNSGYAVTTGGNNTLLGTGAGSGITTGVANTVVGRYNGNQDNFDIRTASKYVVISDGDGERVVTALRGSSLALNDATPKTGTGITFPATQSASSDANTLDDYEEGTFTPTVFGGTSAGTTVYGNQLGYYTKIGRQVTVIFDVVVVSATGTGAIYIGGFPFTATGSSGSSGVGSIMSSNFNWAGGTYLSVYTEINSTRAAIYGSADDAALTQQTILNETLQFWGTITYFTA